MEGLDLGLIRRGLISPAVVRLGLVHQAVEGLEAGLVDFSKL